VTDEWNENEPDERADEDTDVGLIGGGGPAATIDGDSDDDTLDEHGENLREADADDR
jgi:hypothetical protein